MKTGIIGAANQANTVTANTSTSNPKKPSGFGDVLQKTIDSVNASAQESEALVAGLVSGQHANIHETMIAMEKAGIQLRLITKVQNKVVEAYKEIMRLQV